jgi:hypothetical protein
MSSQNQHIYKAINTHGAPFGKETYGTMAAPSESIPVMSHTPYAPTPNAGKPVSPYAPLPAPTPSPPKKSHDLEKWLLVISVLLALGAVGFVIYRQW